MCDSVFQLQRKMICINNKIQKKWRLETSMKCLKQAKQMYIYKRK